MPNWKIIKFLKLINIEPVYFVYFFAHMFHLSVYRFGLYHSVCQRMFGVDCSEMGKSDSSNRTYQELETQAQKETASFQILMNTAVLPAILVDVLLGSWGDKAGRKYNILLGIFGTVFYYVPLIMLYQYPMVTPLWVVLVGHIAANFTGFVTTVTISSFAYTADTVINKDMLTVRMAILQGMTHLGQIFGPLLAGVLSNFMRVAQQQMVALGLVVVAFFLGSILLRQVPPKEMRRMAENRNDKALSLSEIQGSPSSLSQENHQNSDRGLSLSENQQSDKGLSENQKSDKGLSLSEAKKNISDKGYSVEEKKEKSGIFLELWHLLKSVWSMYSRKRRGHIRAYIFATSLVYFCSVLAEAGAFHGVLSYYVQKAPLRWDLAMIGYYDTIHGIGATLGTLLGVFLMKKFLHFADTTLILISMASSVAEMLLVTFATKTWMMFASIGLSVFSYVVRPSCKSFVAKFVDADEVGKAFTVFGISQNVAIALSNLMYSSLYKATLEIFPGTAFAFAALIYFLIFLVVLWMHIDNRRSGNRID